MPLNLLVYELLECTSPIHPRVGSHVYLLSLFLGHLDKPVKLFPVGFIKMVFIHFKFCLMPAPGYFGRHCNKPINKTAVFLLFKLVFPLTHHYRYVVCLNPKQVNKYQGIFPAFVLFRTEYGFMLYCIEDSCYYQPGIIINLFRCEKNCYLMLAGQPNPLDWQIVI